MQSTDKLIYALLTAMTLSLAGCGGSSSKTAGTPADPPEPTELEKLQADAKTAATGAATAVTGATTAVADVLPLQTTGMEDGYHKAESLVQKDKAMAESMKAKEASDNAAKATTEAAAKTAKDAAEAARTAAETARDAAMMDVKYTNGAYKVGDLLITSGARKTETTVTLADGTTQTRITGTDKEYMISAHTARTKVDYRAASGTNPERMSQPAVEARPLTVGRVTDSSDDMARLKLMNKYIGEKMVAIFNDYYAPGQATVQTKEEVLDSSMPYGRVELQANAQDYTVTVMRATGEFYRVAVPELDDGAAPPLFSPTDASGSTLVSAQTISATMEDSNKDAPLAIYYFNAPFDGKIYGKTRKKGEKVFLRLFNTRTRADGTKNQYDSIDVRENVRFPVAKDYQHMNYGVWVKLKDEEGDKDNTTPADLNDVTAFVRPLQDNNMTPVADMPKTGTATWQGHWVGNARAAHAEGTGAITDVSGGSKMTATFGTAMTIKVELMKDDTDMFATLNGKIMGNRFKDAGSATNEVMVDNSVGEVKAGGKFTGSFSGAFFGPDAVETGGVFDYTSEGGKDGQFKGAFGGRKM